ncbi:hypothetical protein BVG81_008550 [Haliangium sp. UPWRP_2]|nr:hypothetical protein BVG81_008550 [Haliangium sp. UPWRP_2]
MSGAARRLSTTPELDPQSAVAVHEHALTPSAASDAQRSQAAVSTHDPQLPDDVLSLRRRVDDLRLDVLLPAQDYSPTAAASKVKRLLVLYQELRQRLDASNPVNAIIRTQLDLIHVSLARVEATTRLAEVTRKHVLKLSGESRRLLKRTLSQPFSGYYYRRRVYRRLIRERDDLISLITHQSLPSSYLPPVWTVALGETFPALQLRYGSPLSDAEMRRITSGVPLADLAPLAVAVESCACDICVSGRKNGAMETEAYLAVLSSCACAYCKFCRTMLWKIDVTKLEHAPAYRDAMLLLRHRLGGPSSLN